MTTRTLLLGDWNPIVRDPLDLMRLGFLGCGLVAVAAGDVVAAFNLLLAFAVLVVARLANLPRLYDLAVIVALAFAQGGEALGLYDKIDWYDRVVHFVVPMLASQVVYLGLARLDVLPDPQQKTLPRHDAGMVVVTFTLGLAIGALWEVFEYASDALVGSDLSMGNADTVGDLVADAAGSLAGGLLMLIWSRHGWGSVRRIPGVNDREDVFA